MLLLVIITMVVIWGMPKITTIIPAPLAGIIFVAVLVISLDIDVPRVGDLDFHKRRVTNISYSISSS